MELMNSFGAGYDGQVLKEVREAGVFAGMGAGAQQLTKQDLPAKATETKHFVRFLEA